MMKVGILNKYSEETSVENMVIMQKRAIFGERIKHLRIGYKAASPIKIQFGYDADDFARNLVSVHISYFVIKVPRLVSKYLLRGFNQKLLRARNRKYR